MAREARSKPRSLSVIFSGYALLVVLFAFFVSDRLAPGWYDVSWTRWILAGYALLGSAILSAVCAGAAARAAALDARIEALEHARLTSAEAAPRAATERAPLQAVPAASPDEPTDQDVEQLLVELQKVGEAVGAEPSPYGEPEPGVRATSDLRITASDELRPLLQARRAIAARVAGPAVGSLALIGVFAALLPASDGMLLADLQLTTFLTLAGFGILVGLVGYAAASLHASSL